MVRVSDTSQAARNAQVEFFRRLTPAERVTLACQMSEEVRELAADGVRHRHPEYSEGEVDLAVRDLLLGEEIAELLRQSG